MLDVKCNFKSGLSNLTCRKCLTSEETQEHLLSCPALVDNSILNTGQVPTYDDLFDDNTPKIEAVGKILMTKFKQFNDKNLTMCTDPHVLLQPTLQNWI